MSQGSGDNDGGRRARRRPSPIHTTALDAGHGLQPGAASDEGHAAPSDAVGGPDVAIDHDGQDARGRDEGAPPTPEPAVLLPIAPPSAPRSPEAAPPLEADGPAIEAADGAAAPHAATVPRASDELARGAAFPRSSGITDPASSPGTARPPSVSSRRRRSGTVALALLAGVLGGAVTGAIVAHVLGDDRSFERRLGVVEEIVRTTTAPATATVVDPRVGELARRLSAIESGAAGLVATPASSSATMEAQLLALGAEIAAIKSAGAGGPASGGAIADVAALRARLDALDEQRRADVQRAEEVGRRVEAVQAAGGEVSKRMIAIESSANDGSAPAAKAVARIAGVQTLRGAMARGVPLSAGLGFLSALGALPQDIEPLRPFAERGAPSGLDLAVRARALDLGRAEDAGANGSGLVDRLAASAAGLVRVRRVGDADTPGAVAARIDAALVAEDWAAASAALGSVSAASRPRVASLADAVRLRLAAVGALDAIEASALADAGRR